MMTDKEVLMYEPWYFSKSVTNLNLRYTEKMKCRCFALSKQNKRNVIIFLLFWIRDDPLIFLLLVMAYIPFGLILMLSCLLKKDWCLAFQTKNHVPFFMIYSCAFLLFLHESEWHHRWRKIFDKEGEEKGGGEMDPDVMWEVRTMGEFTSV